MGYLGQQGIVVVHLAITGVYLYLADTSYPPMCGECQVYGHVPYPTPVRGFRQR